MEDLYLQCALPQSQLCIHHCNPSVATSDSISISPPVTRERKSFIDALVCKTDTMLQSRFTCLGITYDRLREASNNYLIAKIVYVCSARVVLKFVSSFMLYLNAVDVTFSAVTFSVSHHSILHPPQQHYCVNLNCNVFLYCCSYFFVYFLHLRRHSMQTTRQKAILVTWSSAEKRIPRHQQ